MLHHQGGLLGPEGPHSGWETHPAVDCPATALLHPVCHQLMPAVYAQYLADCGRAPCSLLARLELACQPTLFALSAVRRPGFQSVIKHCWLELEAACNNDT